MKLPLICLFLVACGPSSVTYIYEAAPTEAGSDSDSGLAFVDPPLLGVDSGAEDSGTDSETPDAYCEANKCQWRDGAPDVEAVDAPPESGGPSGSVCCQTGICGCH
jgi:hypothetical protein